MAGSKWIRSFYFCMFLKPDIRKPLKILRFRQLPPRTKMPTAICFMISVLTGLKQKSSDFGNKIYSCYVVPLNTKLEAKLQYFKRLDSSIDPTPFLDEIDAIDGIWHEQTGRQKSSKVQREALAIPLRGLRKSAQGNRARRDVHESRWTSGSVRLPVARRFLEKTAETLASTLGRAKIVALPPGMQVYAHIDRGEYYRVRNRYHLVLKSDGSWMRAGDEEVSMKTGELWWFDNNAEHEAKNLGSQNRIHMIFDLLPDAARAQSTAEPARVASGLGNWGM